MRLGDILKPLLGENELHPAVLRSLKADIAQGKRKYADLSREYCVSKPRITKLSKKFAQKLAQNHESQTDGKPSDDS